MEGRRITPHWLVAWFGKAGPWSVDLNDSAVEWTTREEGSSQGLTSSVRAHTVEHRFFSTLTLTVSGRLHAFSGARKKEARAFLVAFNHARHFAMARAAASDALDAVSKPLLTGWTAADAVMQAGRFLAWRERDGLFRAVRELRPIVLSAGAAIKGAVAHGIEVPDTVMVAHDGLLRLSADFDGLLKRKNDDFVEAERARWETFFKVCEASPMTDEQVTVILTEEERTLLVAAAGSGKTSTVVAKVAYLLASGIAEPEEILCLAFNKAAAKEMERRIAARLKHLVTCEDALPEGARERLVALGPRKVTSKTFHSFGLGVLMRAEGRKPSPKSKREDSDFRLALNGLMRKPEFARQWWQLQLVMGHENPPDSQFKTEADYQAYLRTVAKGRLQPDGIKTLGTPKPVRSLQEAAISNWLFVMGVAFEYEKPFAEGAAILCPGRTWLPDFNYSVGDGKTSVSIIHEHFGVNAKGEAPAFFDDPERYVREAKDKQVVLGELDARHFWTTSADWTDGTLFEKLEAALRSAGVAIEPRSTDAILTRLDNIGIEVKDDLVEAAVKHIRGNGFTHGEVLGRARRMPDAVRAVLFAETCWTVAEAVNDVIKGRKGVDFDDMIRRALIHLGDHPDRVPYSRVIVDEFQDTAPGRGEMVRRVLAGPNAPRLLAVGDDWQAINRFAGSDLRFFTRFNDCFGLPEEAYAECRLEKTFRTNQGIADIAGQFVLANNTQMKKTVVADDQSRVRVLDIRPFKAVEDIRAVVDTVLGGWVAGHTGPGKPRVFILSRYGADHTQGFNKEAMTELDAAWADRIDPPIGFRSMFSTMHSSKGMQADYVLLVGMYSIGHHYACFPAERYQDPLGEMFLPAREAVEDAEDRRLLYVALTRAKHRVAMLVQEDHPSRYVSELMNTWRHGEIQVNGGTFSLCKDCGEAMLVRRKRTADGTFFLGCRNFWRHASMAANASAA
jgi:DNA helicase-4